MKHIKQTPHDVQITVKTVKQFSEHSSSAMSDAGVSASAAAVARAYRTGGYVSYIKDGVVVKEYRDGTIKPVK